jgi:hypothetical protein
MKIPLSKILEIAKALYVAFLKGKTVSIPGIGPVTLPSQGQGGAATFSVPHQPGPSLIRPLGLLGNDPKRKDGLATPIYAPVLGFLGFCVVGAPLLLLIAAGVIEAKTLSDDVRGNHLTAQLRAVFARQPAACALGLAVWFAFLSAVVVGTLSHAWWY